MEKISKYIAWVAALIMFCGWLVTGMWLGRIVGDLSEQVKKLNGFYESQLELNGKVIMYIELDSSE